jgi:hypothetical protein
MLTWFKETDCPPNVPDCDCPEPGEAPTEEGQIVYTPCGGSSSSSGLSSSEPSDLCEEICSGTCTWTATTDHYGYGAVIWGVAFGGEPVNNCVQDPPPAPQACGCVFPERLPDFVGDTQVTDCGCCQRCQHAWQSFAWGQWQVGAQACTEWAPGQTCGGLCQTPIWTGQYGEVVLADCGETPVSPNGPEESSSSS